MTSGIYRVTWGGPGNIVWENVGDMSAKMLDMQKVMSVSSSVAAVSSTLGAGLSLVSVIQNAVIITKLNKVQKDVTNIKARFDLLFLDRSFDYFENAHRGRLGIDANIAEALREDCLNALTQLVQDKSLSVPAFLRHRCAVFLRGINQFSQLLYAVLHEGSVNTLERDTIKNWTKKITSLQGVSPDGGYVPQTDLLVLWREELTQRETMKKSGSLVERFTSKDQNIVDEACHPSNFDRCSEVLSLYREIEAYIHYVELLTSKPVLLQKQELLFKLAA